MKLLTICASIALLSLSQAALAIQLSGEVDITGNSIVLDDGTTPTGINWGDVDPGTAGDQGTFSNATGDFAGLLTFPQTVATMKDFTFASLPVVPLWSAFDGTDTFTFELTSINIDSFTLGSSYKFSGGGVIKRNGADATTGRWDYTSQSGLSFSSNTAPEPGILALIGLGLLGMGFVRKYRTK